MESSSFDILKVAQNQGPRMVPRPVNVFGLKVLLVHRPSLYRAVIWIRCSEEGRSLSQALTNKLSFVDLDPISLGSRYVVVDFTSLGAG